MFLYKLCPFWGNEQENISGWDGLGDCGCEGATVIPEPSASFTRARKVSYEVKSVKVPKVVAAQSRRRSHTVRSPSLQSSVSGNDEDVHRGPHKKLRDTARTLRFSLKQDAKSTEIVRQPQKQEKESVIVQRRTPLNAAESEDRTDFVEKKKKTRTIEKPTSASFFLRTNASSVNMKCPMLFLQRWSTKPRLRNTVAMEHNHEQDKLQLRRGDVLRNRKQRISVRAQMNLLHVFRNDALQNFNIRNTARTEEVSRRNRKSAIVIWKRQVPRRHRSLKLVGVPKFRVLH